MLWVSKYDAKLKCVFYTKAKLIKWSELKELYCVLYLCRRIPIKQPKIVYLSSDGRSIDVLGVHLTRTEIMRRAEAGMCDPNLGVTTYRKHISYILLFFANKATSNYAYGWSRPVCTKCFLFCCCSYTLRVCYLAAYNYK